VTLSVSKGPQLTQVPDVTGQTAADAKTLLSGAGYKTAVQVQDVTDPSQDGLVLVQVPVGGGTAKKGATVTITVGKLTAQPTTSTTPTTTTDATTTTPATPPGDTTTTTTATTTTTTTP
jgi:serine/threonine-protein kinase